MAAIPRPTLLVSVAIACVASFGHAWAQSYDQYVPLTMPGYNDPQRGADILQRPLTEYEPLGVRAGNFIIRPHLDDTLSYDSNVLGTKPAAGSALVGNAPQIDINSTSLIHPFSTSFGINDERYLDQPRQSFTDWNLSLGGSYNIGQDTLTLGGSEAYLHQRPTDINSANLTFPLGYKATDIRARYSTSFLRWNFEPDFEYLGYRFDDKNIQGDSTGQKARDRNTFAGGLTVRFGRFTERSLVAVVRAVDTLYIANQGGIPRPDTRAYEALLGFNYAISGNLTTLLLVGYEVRTFSASSAYPTRATPVAEASVVWTPSGLTTIIARASRSIESSVGETTTGLTQSQAQLTVEHEYQRNWRLQARSSINYLEFSNGQPSESLYGIGASATYLFNRNMRLTASYDFTSSASGGTSTLGTTSTSAASLEPTFASSYSRHVISVNLRFAL